MANTANPPDPREAGDRRPTVQDYGRLAHDYDEKRYVGDINVLKENFRRRALFELLPRGANLALDVACGTGRGIGVLREVVPTVVGVDGTQEMLRVAQGKFSRPNRIWLARANAAALPFRPATFDVVTCLNFLHLFDAVSAKAAFIGEIARVLKPGGIAVLEFDNALQGIVIGAVRKYFGHDIGYDWPWDMRRSIPADVFEIRRIRGSNLPGIWRVPFLRFLEAQGGRFPINRIATRTFIQAVRK